MIELVNYWNKVYDDYILIPQMTFIGGYFNLIAKQYMEFLTALDRQDNSTQK